jgi:hypothetical protein
VAFIEHRTYIQGDLYDHRCLHAQAKRAARRRLQAIDDSKIVTWEHDKDGDFTHAPPQWRRKAWLRPFTSSGILQFGLLGQQKVEMTKSIYGVYHGRFIEELLTHFDGDFSTATATAQKDSAVDNFK